MIGFEALNQEKSVTISSAHRPLVYAFRGQVVVANGSVVDRPAVGSVTFPEPVPTIAPPRVFVRLESSRHNSFEMYIVITGSSGAWTGFTIYGAVQGGGTLPRYVLDYVVARPSFREPTSDWAFQLLDDNGNTIFCNDEPLVRFSKFTKKWTLSMSFGSGQSGYYTYMSGLAIDVDDFIDVTFFNRGVVFQTVYGLSYTGLRLYSNGVRVLNMQGQSNLTSSNTQGVAILNFCIPVCKFPADRYAA